MAILPAALWACLMLPLGRPPAGPRSDEGALSIWGVVITAATTERPDAVEVTLHSEHGGRARLGASILVPPGRPFRFTGLRPGIHHLLARSGDLVANRTTSVKGTGAAGPYTLELGHAHELRGRVVSMDGPVPGALVTLRPEPRPGDPTSVGAWFPALEAVAGAEGRFAFTGLPAGSCRIDAQASGNAPTTISRISLPAPEQEVRLAKLANLRVRVVREMAENISLTLPGALVTLHSQATGSGWEALTNQGGVATLKGLVPGTYWVDATKGGLLTYKPIMIEIEEGQDAIVEVFVAPGLALEGTVRDAADSTPIDSACLVVSSRGETPRLACGSSNVKGRFRILGLAPGKYSMVAVADGYLRKRLPRIELAQEANELVEIQLVRSLRITGTVRDAEGRPVEGARIFADEAEKLSSSLFEGFLDIHLPSLVPDDPGVLAIGELGVTLGPVPPIPLEPEGGAGQLSKHVPEHELPPGCECLEEVGAGPGRGGLSAGDGSFVLDGITPGEVNLVVVHPGFATLKSPTIALSPGQEPAPVILVLAPGGILGGRVLDPQGIPVTGALVWIEGPSTFLAQPIAVGPDGTYRADHVSGEVKVSASCTGYFSASRVVTVAPGSASLAVDLVLEPEGERMKARVLDHWAFPVPDALVTVNSASSQGGLARSVRTDADGMFSFPALPGSPWTVVVSHPSHRTLRTVLEPWEPYEEPELAMGLAAGVSGSVMDSWSHLPLDAFTVTILRDGEKVASRAFTDGSFSLSDLPPGPCTLRLTAEIHQTLETEIILPEGSGPTHVTLPDLTLWMDPLDPGT